MANLVDKTGTASSNLVAGNGTNSAEFTMPGSVELQVESVVATIDNFQGLDANVTLVVRDQAGEVIATKRQEEVMPGGDTGTATFALRLPASSAGGIKFKTDNEGDWLFIQTTGGAGPLGKNFDLLATGLMRLWATSTLTVQSDVEVLVSGNSGGSQILVANGILISGGSGSTTVHLITGKKLEVTNNAGAAIFRVNEDGSLQGKTGKALTFNL